MVTTQETLSSLLQKFNAAQKTKGSAIVTRDGLPLVSALPAAVNRETFAAMIATMMGAAETAAAELETADDTTMTFSHGKLRIAAAGAGPEILVVAIGDAGHSPSDLLSAVMELADSVRRSL